MTVTKTLEGIGGTSVLFLLDQGVKEILRSAHVPFACNHFWVAGADIPGGWIIGWSFFFLLGFIGLWLSETDRITAWGCLLVIGGGAGNLFDRMTYGCVVDYIRVGAFPVFNLADVFLTVGVAVILWQRSKTIR